MKRMMVFRQMYYDTQIFNGASTMSFFRETDENSESVASMTEAQAVEWLFNRVSFSPFFSEGFFDNTSMVRPFFNKKDPFVIPGKKPGDIDILLIDSERPDKAVAFECKRLKVSSRYSPLPKVNNVNGIRQGVKQANGLQSLGFYRSYLMILLLDDSRHFSYANTMMRNSKWPEVEEVYDIPWNEPLHPDVGIVFVKVTQPTGKHFNEMAGIGYCIDKAAGPQEQTPAMNNKVKELLNVS